MHESLDPVEFMRTEVALMERMMGAMPGMAERHPDYETAIRMNEAMKGVLAEIDGLREENRLLHKPHYVCSICGYDPGNRPTWCNKGCGSDYNRMHEVVK